MKGRRKESWPRKVGVAGSTQLRYYCQIGLISQMLKRIPATACSEPNQLGKDGSRSSSGVSRD